LDIISKKWFGSKIENEYVVKKIIIYIFLLSSLFAINETYATNQKDTETVVWSFKNGSSQHLTKFFSKGVFLNINGNQGEYSARQAEIVLKDFFKKHTINEFIVMHEGNHPKDFVQLLANYISSNESFKVIIKGKTENDQLTIFSIDIIRH
jgi:hypothetical protein